MNVDFADFDPLDQELSENLWERLAQMRECPVAHTDKRGGMWLLSRHGEVLEAARNWEDLTSTHGSGIVPIPQVSGIKMIPIHTDPPVQREYRRLIDRHFGPKKMPDAEAAVRAKAVELISAFAGDGNCDFVAQFTVPFPVAAFFDFAFGVEMAEAEKVLGWLDTILASPAESSDAISSFFEWTRVLIEVRRASGERRGDVLDALLDGNVLGEDLTDRQRMMVIMNLVTGGIETTTHALSNAIFHLAAMPALRQQLDADPALIPAAVEEFLRFEAPAPGQGRTATRPVTIGKTNIQVGERVVLYYGSANRDPRVYDHPEEIRPDRFRGETAPHLTFGAGPHRCPGAHFARLELRVAIEEVLGRLKGLELASDEFTYTTGLTRGLKSLPLKFRASALS